MVKRDNKPALEIVRDITDHIAYDYIFLTNGFGLHNANELMRLLNTGLEIKFESFKQYQELIKYVNCILSKKLRRV